MVNLTVRTAYLGPEASFSHQAAVEALPATEPVPLPSFEAILKAIQEKEYDYAVLPVENSTNGSVVQALDLLALYGLDPQTSLGDDVEVVDEHYLEVHHCLFAARAWAEARLSNEELASLPVGAEEAGNLDTILKKLDTKTLYSHPQVWGQCNNVLSTLLPPGHVERVDTTSTSAAAAYVAGHGEVEGGGCAAISSSLAGEKYKNSLVCIARNIEDESGANTTRFLILRNRRRLKDAATESALAGSKEQIKSLWTFTIAHHQPGALAQTLAVFAKHDFNLSAIQSRPRPKAMIESALNGEVREKNQDKNWKYVFFVECLHSSDGLADGGIDELLNDLRTATEQVSLLGCWKDRLS